MLWIIGIAGVLIGAALGAAAAYLLCDRGHRSADADRRAQSAVLAQRVEDLSARLQHQTQQTQQEQSRAAEAERQAAALSAQLEASRQNLDEQRRLLDEVHNQLRQAFAQVSAEALRRNNEAFLDLARQRFETLTQSATGSLEQKRAQIEGLLKPMQELLNLYQGRLTDIEKSRVESYSMLREQLGTLAETQRLLHTQTHQLVSALSRPQTRGQWGEISLRRLVELAGMSSRCDFIEQVSVDSDDGRQRPDMIVRLPGEREVIIDCKAVLDAFLDAAAAADDEQRRQCLQRHSQQVRSRMRELGGKAYWNQFSRAPEFVVMFLPGEAFLYAAIDHDPALLEDCLARKVILATPSTLMALLKAIEHGWRQQAISENAEAIRRLGQELYERIFTLAQHVQRVGSSLETTVQHYNSAIGSLESRVLVTARKMGELGARSDKELPDLAPVEKQPRAIAAAVIGAAAST